MHFHDRLQGLWRSHQSLGGNCVVWKWQQYLFDELKPSQRHVDKHKTLLEVNIFTTHAIDLKAINTLHTLRSCICCVPAALGIKPRTPEWAISHYLSQEHSLKALLCQFIMYGDRQRTAVLHKTLHTCQMSSTAPDYWAHAYTALTKSTISLLPILETK